jgi:hypothetical protein
VREARTCPARRVLARAAQVNTRLGHENLGSLSAGRGFVPVRAPLQSFPASHAPWDEAAAALPALYRDLAVRPALDRLPVLPADATALPAAALQRAATVLGILGHAYVHNARPEPVELPPGIALPWAEVRLRLDRAPEPVLAYTDLIVNNWQIADDGNPSTLRVGGLDLLVPVVDNREERVFYLSQVEILARCAPIVPAVAAAQDAVLNDDAAALRHALESMTDALGAVSRASLTLIDPRPTSATHVDPVIWAKTVAPLAVPFRPGVLGPSGTASPIFNLLDVFLDRRASASRLGREMALHRNSYPVHWRRFLDAVERVSVADHVAAHPGSGAATAFDQVREAYAGPDGFLGHHRRKVYGYLAVAFKVGRGVTIGGFRGAPRESTWNEVDAALTESRTERPAGRPVRPAPHRSAPAGLAGRAGRGITVSDLATRNDDAHGWWVAIGGRVHDVTGFVARHPGGDAVLRAHAGLDATNAFERAHGHAGPERLLRRTDIGHLVHPSLTQSLDVYRAWVDALFTVIDLQNTFRLDRSFGRGTDLCVPGGCQASALQLDRAVDTCLRFRDAYLPQLATEVLRPLADRLPGADGGAGRVPERGSSDDAGRFVPAPRAAASPTAHDRVRGLLDHVDRDLVVVGALLRSGVRRFEEHGDDAVAGPELRRLVQRASALSFGRGGPAAASTTGNRPRADRSGRGHAPCTSTRSP